MRELVNLNGEIRAREQAVISVFDRGFLYGDSVYETLRTYGQVPFLLERHLDRLEASAGRIGIPVPDRGRIGAEADRTCRAADPGEYLVRIVVTRGEGPAWPEGPPVGLDPSPCRRPNLVILVVPFPEGIGTLQEQGVTVSIVPVRRNPAVALDPSIKSSNQLNNILAVAARGRSAFEAIMRNPQGYVAEGASSNVFIVRGGEARTPPLAAGILEGITREVVLQLAADAGIPAREADILPEDLLGAEECFLTSTIKEVMPIVECDGRRIGSGRPGAVTRTLQGRFRDLVAACHPPR